MEEATPEGLNLNRAHFKNLSIVTVRKLRPESCSIIYTYQSA